MMIHDDYECAPKVILYSIDPLCVSEDWLIVVVEIMVLRSVIEDQNFYKNPDKNESVIVDRVTYSCDVLKGCQVRVEQLVFQYINHRAMI